MLQFYLWLCTVNFTNYYSFCNQSSCHILVLLVKILLQACLLRKKVKRQILVFATFNFILNLVFCIQQHSIYKLKIGLNFAYRRIEGFEFSSLFDDSKYDYHKHANEALYTFKKLKNEHEIVIMSFHKIMWWQCIKNCERVIKN